MTGARLWSLDQPGLKPLDISARLRSQLVYFISSPDAPGVPPLADDELFFARPEAQRWLDEGVIELVSPLDTANMTEVELSEEQESLLQWLVSNNVQHVRVQD